MELLPATYTFSVDYAFGRSTKSQNVATDPNVMFQTGKVRSISGTCIQYYGQGGQNFVNNMELLPSSWSFRFNDTAPNSIITVTAGNLIH